MNLRKKLCANYDIYNIWNFPQGFGLKVPTSTCSVTCTPGFRKFYQEQAPDCCFDCAWCPENEISNETALVLGAFVKYNGTPIVKANNRTLSYILLVSITFCFLCALFFIGHPNTVTCILQQTTFGVFFTVAVSTVLAKTITVVLAFKLTTPGRRMRRMLLSGVPNFVIPICTLFQSVVCGIWLVTSPPFIDTDTSEHGQIIIVCNKGSVIAFHFVLGYLGSLALGSFTVAFLARNLPDRFNEAKFLTFSMLVFCCVWVTFLPVYHSTKGKGNMYASLSVFLIS
ncbi:vomeronasal type-2 receptor [Cricetulus griseus]|uniref:Vomeronasal type-2 receptor n=1 Tax=Cricetulus griseus TaxID=10029 RepID=A0A061I187_CRIGR|nr:vomeronasal type-2 receptor [Cricetulus griseus]